MLQTNSLYLYPSAHSLIHSIQTVPTAKPLSYPMNTGAATTL